MTRGQWIGGVMILALAGLTGVGLWKTASDQTAPRSVLVRHPEGVMGTTCTLLAVVGTQDEGAAPSALDQAEDELRSVESAMSTWLADSEVSRFNSAPENHEIALSAGTRLVLRAAERALHWTGGAFDATCRPLIRLWRDAGDQNRLPVQKEIDLARAVSRWKWIEITDSGAIKRAPEASVDLGGIAKGYAIDRAARALHDSGIAGGMVDVGGDLVCFGHPRDGEFWIVDVKNPFGGKPINRLRIPCGAVCTSGNYARFNEIEGTRYSHIIDPRTGRPADAAAAVTVVASTALMADIWATALSVLGPDGLELLPDGIEALLVLGDAEHCRLIATPGMLSLLETPSPEMLTTQP